MPHAIHRPETFNHHTAKINGVDIHYVREGAGEPLLLVHGWPGFWWEWSRVIPELAKDFLVIAPDMRGFGASEKPDFADVSNFELRHTVEDLSQLLRSLDIESANVVGHDWSSLVLHKFVRSHPEQTKKMLIMNPLFPGVEGRYLSPAHFPESWYSQFHQLPMSVELVGHSRETIKIYFRHFFLHYSADPATAYTDEELDVLVDNFLVKGNVEGGFSWYRANLSVTSVPFDQLDRMPTGLPTRVLWGMADPVVPSVWSDYISDWYTNFTFRPLPGVGHFCMWEAPEIIVEEARGFFDH